MVLSHVIEYVPLTAMPLAVDRKERKRQRDVVLTRPQEVVHPYPERSCTSVRSLSSRDTNTVSNTVTVDRLDPRLRCGRPALAKVVGKDEEVVEVNVAVSVEVTSDREQGRSDQKKHRR